MAASPRWKVYDADGTYQASCHEIEGAACLMSLYGKGATIRDGHLKRDTVWSEGVSIDTDEGTEVLYDGCAYNSYDTVADVAYRRVAGRKQARGN